MNIMKLRKKELERKRVSVVNKLLKPLGSYGEERLEIPERYTEEEPLIIDNSTLSTLATCSTKAMLNYHFHLTSNTDSHSLLVGGAAHKALEAFFRGEGVLRAMEVFKENYFDLGSVLDPEEGLSWENTSTTLETWFAGHSLESLPFVPVKESIEKAVTFPLWEEKWGKRVLFLGLVDSIIEDKTNGAFSVLDHKTTSKRLDESWANQFKTSSQLTGYIWLVQQEERYRSLSSAYINTIQFSRLPASGRKCKTHSVSYEICKGLHANARIDGPFFRTPLQIQEWLWQARKLAVKWAGLREEFVEIGKLRGVEKEGMFLYEACKFCSFTDFCSGLIREPGRLGEFYREKKWEPWKREEKNET